MTPRPKRYYRNMTPTVAIFLRWLYFDARLKQGQIGDIVGMRQGSVSRIVSGQVWGE